MTGGLIILNLILFATVLMAFPYVLDRIAVRGILGAMSNPKPDDAPLHAWAERAKAAHANAVENLVVFAPALLVVEYSGVANGATTAAAVLYLIARLLHYFVYTLGVPVVRTVAFFVGWGATAFLIARAGGVL